MFIPANDSNQEFNNEGESPTAPLDSKEQDGGEQVGVGPRRRKRKSKSKYSNMEHDNLEKMLQWKNGIGYLEGISLIHYFKYCYSSFFIFQTKRNLKYSRRHFVFLV